MRQRLVVLGTAALVVACSSSAAAPLSDAERASIVDSVTAAMHAYADAFPPLDHERIVRFYRNSPEFRVWMDGHASTRDETVAMVRGIIGGLRAAEGVFESVQVSVIDRNAAIATSPFRDVMTDTAGAVTRLRGTVSWTWVRGPEGWQILHGNAWHFPDTSTSPLTRAK